MKFIFSTFYYIHIIQNFNYLQLITNNNYNTVIIGNHQDEGSPLIELIRIKVFKSIYGKNSSILKVSHFIL